MACGSGSFLRGFDVKRLKLIAGALTGLLMLAQSPVLAADCKASPAPSVDWQDCNKSRLMIPGSALAGANLTSTDLSYTDLRNSNLSGAKLEKATLFRASLNGSNVDKANLSRIEGYRTTFVGVSAQGASFASAELQRADFRGANLTGADFQKAELGRAVFADAVITGAKFAMANLARANLAGARFEGPLDFSGGFLFLTRLDGLDLSQATGLEQWQIDQACGDASTRLPASLSAPADWACPAGE